MTTWRLFPPRDVISELTKINRDMSRLMSGLPSHRTQAWSGVYPPVNMAEDSDGFTLTAEIPGVASADIDVSVVADSLTVSGERKIVSKEGASYHRRERAAGKFRRVLTLPAVIDTTRVEAKVAHGILTVRLPKAEEAKPRQIKVNG